MNNLTLRDYFAARAMQAELSTQTEEYMVEDFEALAERCYKIADAMIEIKLKTQTNKTKKWKSKE